MAWHAKLDLHYASAPLADGAPRTTVQFKHDGPLRMLQSLYPEGPAVCHNVLVHPPGGIVGGDTLDIAVQVATGAHALITTPAATRFYKSMGEPGTQQVKVQLHSGARLEWLPLETLVYNGCNAHNSAVFDIASGAEMIGWDITALGLPHANQPFERGSLQQHIEVTGAWLERALIDAADTRLLHSPLGLAGNLCMGSLFFATGDAITRERRERLLEIIRAVVADDALASTTGATAPNNRVVVVRSLAPMVEPMVALLRRVWVALRHAAWDMPAEVPRIWAM
ncbi:MAG: urease accessory protein UreD [Burkholderiaceae bacterium]